MDYKVSYVNNLSGGCDGDIWIDLQAWIIAYPIISMFLSTPLLKSVSLQKVEYSFGLSFINDSISSIAERMSERYFRNFLSIDQIFGFFKFLFEIGVLYR